MVVTLVNYISLDVVTREVEAQGRTAKVGAKVLTRRVVVIVLVLVLVLGVVRGGRRPVGRAGRVTRPSHSAAKIRICNTQQPLPTSHPFSCRCPTNDCSLRLARSEPPSPLRHSTAEGQTRDGYAGRNRVGQWCLRSLFSLLDGISTLVTRLNLVVVYLSFCLRTLFLPSRSRREFVNPRRNGEGGGMQCGERELWGGGWL